jgi:outer membrane protein assembly factor BamB
MKPGEENQGKMVVTSLAAVVVSAWIILFLPSGAQAAIATLIVSGLARRAADLPIQELWHKPIQPGSDPPSCTPATDDRYVFVVASDVEAYSIETGQLMWRSPLRNYIPRSLVTAGGRVFVAETTVSALDSVSGRRLWEFTPDANASLGRAATDGNALYFGTASHHLYALSAADGRKLWAVDVAQAWKYPAVVRGLTVWRDELYATLEQWEDEKGRTSTGWLMALNAKNGKIRWRYRAGGPTGQRLGFSSSPVVTSRFVVAGDFLSNAIVALDRQSGHEIWKFQAEPGFAGFPEAPVLIGDILYAGSGDTHVYALDLATGRLIWRSKLPGSVENYAVCGQQLLVNDQELAVLDPLTGQVIQRALNTEQDFATSGPAISRDKAFLSGPKAVYAFRCR